MAPITTSGNNTTTDETKNDHNKKEDETNRVAVKRAIAVMKTTPRAITALAVVQKTLSVKYAPEHLLQKKRKEIIWSLMVENSSVLNASVALKPQSKERITSTLEGARKHEVLIII